MGCSAYAWSRTMSVAASTAVLFAIVLLPLFLGCDLVEEGVPPFVLYGVRSETGVVVGFHHVAGVYFDILNTSDETIAALEGGFFLFDANGRAAPRNGSNYFEIAYAEPIAPMERREVCIAVDGAFSYLPHAPLDVDRFAITKVIFDDGSLWQDHLGVYMWVEAAEGPEIDR